MECGKIHLRGSFQDETNNIESDKKKISQLLNQSLLTCSLVMNSDSLVSDLTKKERATSDEIEEAHKVAVMV
jgi:hypothetical protein